MHTEYFFCSVCHAEVKHCHRNVLMHLQRSHGMNTQVGLACRIVACMMLMLAASLDGNS